MIGWPHIATVCALLLWPVVLPAQSANTRSGRVYQDPDRQVYAEAFGVPKPGTDSTNIYVLFKVSNDVLTFTKNTDHSDPQGNFVAPIALNIEVRDSLGVIRKRVRWSNSAYASTFDETNSRNQYSSGWQMITVACGLHTVTLEVVQNKINLPTKVIIDSVASQTCRNQTSRQLILGVPEPGEPRDSYRPFIQNGNAEFIPHDAYGFLPVRDSTPAHYSVSIRQQPYGGNQIRWWSVASYEWQGMSTPNVRLDVSGTGGGSEPRLHIVPDSTGGGFGYLKIPFPVTALVPAEYTVTVVRENSTDSVHIPVHVVWNTMPQSLRNLNDAIQLLRYTAAETDIRNIDNGTDAERREKLMDWWRGQDPTPRTTYNERLYEYYRRADYARLRYATVQEPDGANTERGKIYILFGPPTSVATKMNAQNSATELWTYSNSVAKTIVFEVDERGYYKLVAIDKTK